LDSKYEQELNQYAGVFPRISPASIEEITAMEHPVAAEVALFIHRPYA